MAYCSGMQGRNTEKAKKWMIAQLRCATTPVLPNSNLIEFGEYWGFTGQECMEMMVDKVSVDRCVKTLNYWLTDRQTKNE